MTMFSEMAAGLLAVTIAITPSIGFAKDNHPGKGRGHDKKAAVETVHKNTANKNLVRTGRTVIVANCPPGLAKKNPPCVPPGQAAKGQVRGVSVGDILDLSTVHIIRDPGRYGLGVPPSGNRYAIVDGRLVRVDSETGRLLSIIRLVNAILD